MVGNVKSHIWQSYARQQDKLGNLIGVGLLMSSVYILHVVMTYIFAFRCVYYNIETTGRRSAVFHIDKVSRYIEIRDKSSMFF